MPSLAKHNSAAKGLASVNGASIASAGRAGATERRVPTTETSNRRWAYDLLQIGFSRGINGRFRKDPLRRGASEFSTLHSPQRIVLRPGGPKVRMADCSRSRGEQPVMTWAIRAD